MATVAPVRSDKSSSPRRPVEAAWQELDSLRAVLDQKLAALEAGLANPSHCGSLESLVIELARVATAEAEAAAAKACADVQKEADREAAARADAQRELEREVEARSEAQRETERQSAARAEAQRALKAERDASVALKRELEQLRAALEAERKLAVTLRRDADTAAAARQDERETAIGLRRRLEEAEAKCAQEQAACTALRKEVEQAQAGAGQQARSIQKQLETRLEDERAANTRLAEKIDSLEREIAAAQQAADARAADLSAAQALIDGIEQQRAELERMHNERVGAARALSGERDAAQQLAGDLQARVDAVLQERDRISSELTAARQAISAAEARLEQQTLTLGDDARQAVNAAEAKARAAERDRDMVAEELEVMRESLATVQNESQAQIDEIRDAAARRIADLEATLAERDRTDADEESPAPPRSPAPRTGHVIRFDEAAAASKPPSSAPLPLSPAFAPLPPGSPVRRASRQAFHEDLQVLIDGTPATLVDLSITGAQVISQAALKPNRMVRLQLPGEDNTQILCKGKVVWARLEASATSGLRYRAGVFFTGADERAVERFIALHGTPTAD